MKKFKLLMSVALLSAVFSACKKAETLETFSGSKDLSAQIVDPSKVVRPYDIDVVYFVPQGSTPLPRYQERMSQLRRRVESFFANNMLENGFGEKYPFFNAYGTNVPTNGKVRLIYGKYPMSSYVGGEVGLQTAADEVDAYFVANNIKARSEYKLIVIPGVGPNSFTATDAFVPCSSPEKRAFLVDYKQFSAENTVMETNAKFISAFGPYLHELGHAFGLQHHNSVDGVANSGELLMSKPSPAYSASLKLSSADCRILSFNQVFNTTTDKSFTSTNQFRVTSMKGGSWRPYDAGPLVINGVYEVAYGANIGIAGIIAYDDPSNGDEWRRNSDYDATVVYQSNESGNAQKKFSISIPRSAVTNASLHRVNVCFLLTNGLIVKRSYRYCTAQNFQLGSNDVQLISDVPTDLERSNWEILATSSEDVGGLVYYRGYATSLLDNNTETQWMPTYPKTGSLYPNEALIDCKRTITAKSFWLTETSSALDYSPGVNYEVQVSNDGVNFRVAANFNTPPKTQAAQTQIPRKQYVNLKSTESFRYFKIVGVKQLSGSDYGSFWLSEVGFNANKQ